MIFLLQCSQAQITFDQGDVLQPGFWFVQQHDTVPTVQPGNSGATSWDFSALNSHTSDTLTAMDTENTPYASDYLSSDFAVENPNGGNPLYFFLSNETNGLFMDGVGGDPSGMGLPMAINYNPQEQILEFPATYNTSFSSTSVFDEKVATTAFPGADSVRIKSTNTRNATIDAWGMVTTPSGTYDALRQYETNDRTDSVWAHVAIIGWIPVFDTISTTNLYQWIAKNVGYALIEMGVDIDGFSTYANWISFTTYNSAGQVAAEEMSMEMYPNPATDEFMISCSGLKGEKFALMITDITGKSLILSEITRNQKLPAEKFSPGIYFVRVEDADGNSATGKLVVE